MSDTSPTVMTVLGPVSADDLGPTLPHEHVVLDITCYWRLPPETSLRTFAEAPVDITNLGLIRRNPLLNRDNCLLGDLDAAIEELMEFRKLGGGTIVDVTPADIGRDPKALQIASRMTGLHIIGGCGYYVYHSHPGELGERSLDSVTQEIIEDVTEGIGQTDIRAGIIGEIGTSHPLHPAEDKVLRAAAGAHLVTGVPITIHVYPAAREGHGVLDILEAEGVDLHRVVMGHLDTSLGHVDIGFEEAVAYHQSLAERGCFLEYDTCGTEAYIPGLLGGTAFWFPSDGQRAKAVARLIELGFQQQILLSQDVCKKIDLVRYGGFGYGHILRNFVENLRDFGVGDGIIRELLIENPRRMLIPST